MPEWASPKRRGSQGPLLGIRLTLSCVSRFSFHVDNQGCFIGMCYTFAKSMSRRSLSLLAAAAALAGMPLIALAQWQGPSGSPPNNNASGPVWLQSGAPAAQSGSFNVTDGVTTNSTSTALYVNDRIGIGSNTPALFTIRNNVAGATFSSMGNYQIVLWTGGVANSTYGLGVQSGMLSLVTGGGFRWLRAGSVTTMTLTNVGNLGINDDTPSYRLDVNGSMQVVASSTFRDDVYTTGGKAMRTDGAGATTFNVGNWGIGATGFTMGLYGDIDVLGFSGTHADGSVTSREFCLAGDTCITAWPSSASGTLTGSGTTNYLAKFTGATSLGQSGIYNAAGDYFGIGTASPRSKLDVVSGVTRAVGVTGTTAGIWSVGTAGVGGHFQGTMNGIEGVSTGASYSGVVGTSAVGNGVTGVTTAAGARAVNGVSSGAANGFGVYGLATGSGANGVYGGVVSSNSIGVRGSASTGNGVGVQGSAYGSEGIGVDGYASGANGIGIRAQGAIGVYASGTDIGIESQGGDSAFLGNGTVYGANLTGGFSGAIGVGGTFGLYGSGSSAGAYATNGPDSAYLGFGGYGLYTSDPVYMGGGSFDLQGGTRKWYFNTRSDNGDLELIPGNNGVLDSNHRLWINSGTGHIFALGFDNWSDARLKNIKDDYTGGLDVIEQLQPKNFTWKADASKGTEAPNQVGFIAQEVQNVLPDAVATGSDPDGTLGINQMVFTSTLVNAIKELKAENDDLKARLDDLTKRLEALEQR